MGRRKSKVPWKASRGDVRTLFARAAYTPSKYDSAERREFYNTWRDRMLILTLDANASLRYAANFNPGLEVGGFGHTFINANGDIVCDEIYIPPQVVQTGHTDIKGPEEEGGSEMLDTAQRYIATHCGVCRGEVFDHGELHRDHEYLPESWDNWRLWWHSHGKLGVTPSGTDHNTLFSLARWWNDWSVGLVIDSAGNRHAWAAVVNPFRLDQEIPFGVHFYESPTCEQRVAEMMSHVEEKKWGYQGAPNQGNGRSSSSPNGASPTGTGTGGGTSKLPRQKLRAGVLPGGKTSIIDLTEEEFKQFIEDNAEELEKIAQE